MRDYMQKEKNDRFLLTGFFRTFFLHKIEKKHNGRHLFIAWPHKLPEKYHQQPAEVYLMKNIPQWDLRCVVMILQKIPDPVVTDPQQHAICIAC